MQNQVCRIAVFYDGSYFKKVSDYYLFQHERRARLSIKGLHEFITAEVARVEGLDARQCQIVDASYFRGRLTAQQAQDQNTLYSDRMLEDVLMRADVTMFQQHVFTRPDGTFEEKSIDVWLALEAYEMASLKKYDLIVLISGDGDFVPLVRKLNTLGTKVMLLGWDFSFEYKGRMQRTRVSSALIERANYAVMMDAVIDARERRSDPFVNNLFLTQSLPQAGAVAAQAVAPERNIAEGEPGQMAAGSVAHLALDKGFGFIKPDEQEGSSLFFHVSELQGVTLPELSVGSRVRFVFGTNERGACARSVSLEPSPADAAGALESI
ncbi:uncharacterized LabA/DUF88 family protein/cold shock CspA family protein [Inhella inkyongensis]|uniref:Uncharacterized LabA/DUF88 family protein/cold shock CspA family protein n=1 Tax=Inhella inkyongensis TaxID=392593 RepID=A0A840S5L0_9BURK|nr:NYN domain-containing protein [Inhella inkyongensis]MBB5203790.1 uncharacterized LabA/DUF88 family protein/cold shock CspA family protein [Inhella inkyongensis]